MGECTKCEKMYGLRFNRGYEPSEFIEGKKNSRIWIVGLNPAEEQNWQDKRTIESLELWPEDINSMHHYFKDFRAVSEELFQNFGKNNGTAHTDIVKCSSKKFPPETVKGKVAIGNVINNCKGFLEEQIKTHKPKIIVCNGAVVSKFMTTFLPPSENNSSENQTCYWSSVDGSRIGVVLSGFIGRIDNYSKRRLGKEIEEMLRSLESET